MRTEFDMLVTLMAVIMIVGYILDDYDNVVGYVKEAIQYYMKKWRR